VKPDFTIDNINTGKRFYWEHLGMMTKTDYREKWEKKLASYIKDGFVLHLKASSKKREGFNYYRRKSKRRNNSQE